jgi:nucleoid-associated protein YgaU
MGLTKAVIINKDAPVPLPVPVMFNPPTYSLTKTNQFAEIRVPGLPSTILQYVSGDAQTLSTELFFDTTDTGVDVRTRTAAISNLTRLDLITRAPPRLLLLWGSLVFQCILTSVREEFEQFNSLGMPLRARLTVELKGWDEVASLIAAMPLPLADEVGRYFVKSGDTLSRIAAEHYRDATQWRRVAEANAIDNPRALTAGMRLRIPGLR